LLTHKPDPHLCQAGGKDSGIKKAAMMPKAWMLALIKSALAATPLHQLMVLSMDKKTLKKIERILRGFLWVARAAANGGHCHVNWSRVCRPLRLGGLGIPDLGRTVISLWVHWVRRMRTDPCDLGAGSICTSLRRRGRSLTYPPSWL
jgi:hypothetical protein